MITWMDAVGIMEPHMEEELCRGGGCHIVFENELILMTSSRNYMFLYVVILITGSS